MVDENLALLIDQVKLINACSHYLIDKISKDKIIKNKFRLSKKEVLLVFNEFKVFLSILRHVNPELYSIYHKSKGKTQKSLLEMILKNVQFHYWKLESNKEQKIIMFNQRNVYIAKRYKNNPLKFNEELKRSQSLL